MVRPIRLSNQMRYARSLAVAQTGASFIGKTKKGTLLYKLGGGVFTGKSLARGRARYASLYSATSYKQAKRMVGL